jgi:hypothetical protein
MSDHLERETYLLRIHMTYKAVSETGLGIGEKEWIFSMLWHFSEETSIKSPSFVENPVVHRQKMNFLNETMRKGPRR